MTIAELIAGARSSVKQLFDDNLLSDRFIYSRAKIVTSKLVKREINLRRLSNSDNIFTPIECLDLVKVKYTECGITCEGDVRRSKNKLPKLEEGLYSYIIQGVYNIDNSEEIEPTTVREQINLMKLKYKPNKQYYIIKDGYLYILDRFIEGVNIYLYILDPLDLQDSCDSAYEAEFKIPGYLEDDMFSILSAELTRFISSPQDVTDNNLDEKN